ncbi:LiaF transmembrane domain-containing protein [Marinicrinis sediminis]|uniref:LiaF transmembrane domain-containing protein n=1 Tax=Marinicrinis sediminis TaxID=1652465 RepID=A0ABW5RC87_9BACL
MNSRKALGALLFISLGLFILLGQLGWIVGNLIGWLVPIAMILLGYYGVKHGKGFIGWILLIIGTVSLLGKMSGLIGWLIAIGLIWYGLRMLKPKRAA